jgi:hypothetical protein
MSYTITPAIISGEQYQTDDTTFDEKLKTRISKRNPEIKKKIIESMPIVEVPKTPYEIDGVSLHPGPQVPVKGPLIKKIMEITNIYKERELKVLTVDVLKHILELEEKPKELPKLKEPTEQKSGHMKITPVIRKKTVVNVGREVDINIENAPHIPEIGPLNLHHNKVIDYLINSNNVILEQLKKC